MSPPPLPAIVSTPPSVSSSSVVTISVTLVEAKADEPGTLLWNSSMRP
jgi:hypothetical protein